MSDQTSQTIAEDDEFYVGYLPSAPVGIARRVRGGVIISLVVACGAALAIAASFRRPAAAVWQDRTEQFVGELVERPYPSLRVVNESSVSRYLIVATGKHGAAEDVRGLDGRMVRIEGTTLERDGRRIIELADGAGRPSDAPADAKRPPPANTATRGHRTISGEIVDPKCFFGAMKPGEGKLHKACAIRCIDGGIPPMLAERNAAGKITYYLLVLAGDADNRRDGGTVPANRRVLPFVAEPVAVTGELTEVDGLSVLILDNSPEAIIRR